MRISAAIALLGSVAVGSAAACGANQAAPVDPTVTTATPSSTTTPPDTTTVDASTSLDAGTTASDPPDASTASAGDDAGGSAQTGNADAGASAFQACAKDSDCVAVTKNSCCKNGYKEAVASGQEAAYKASFKCPDPKPMCPMYFINDLREPECNNGTHLCEMVAADKIACGGFIKNQNPHSCPSGYKCQLPKGKPDLPGTCVK